LAHQPGHARFVGAEGFRPRIDVAVDDVHGRLSASPEPPGARRSTSPSAAIGLVAADGATPDGVHPEHPGAAPLANHRVLRGAGATRRRWLGWSRTRVGGKLLRIGLSHDRDYRSPFGL